MYVAGVFIAGAVAAATFLPTHINRPILFSVLLVVGYLTSTWKVNLPLPLANGSTLSVSYAADLMSLLVVGPEQAMVVAMTGAWAQCARLPKRGYPFYRTIFSVAAVALTMRAVAVTYTWLNGTPAPASLADLAKPLVGVIAVYFVINTGLVALAIALATRQWMWPIWRDNFLWSAPSFIVAGFAGALAAIVVAHGDYWLAVLLVAPVYLTYRTYRVFLGRIEDEQRHAAETRGLHREAVDALSLAQTAERALASEKERLAVTLRSVGDGVIAADTAGVVRVFNRAAEILTGWTHDEACGRPLDDVFHNLDAAGQSAGRRAQRGPRLSRRPRAADPGGLRAAARRRRPRHRPRPGLPRRERRDSDSGGADESEQARIARPARRRHRPRLQQHSDRHPRQHLPRATHRARRRNRRRPRGRGRSLRARAATDATAAHICQGRRTHQEIGRHRPHRHGIDPHGAVGRDGELDR
ncbi:MAG: hypothetical protein AUJ01_05845 [Acidobacteria bacterium 13_1_40CM_3_65_5]|nr:MAG: hypothetical protein AUJ01_05845 [Acidobacteria bacterium 13_1_40CM_3_65_5]